MFKVGQLVKTKKQETGQYICQFDRFHSVIAIKDRLVYVVNKDLKPLNSHFICLE